MNGEYPYRAALYTVLFLIVAGIGALAVGAHAAGRPAESTNLHFKSAGKEIKVEYFPITGTSGKPAVVVLHGAGGSIFDGPDMRRMSERLARAGHPAYFVHYFDRTDTPAALDSTMRAHFDEWLPTVRDAIAWVRARPEAGGRPVGVYGYSLGAFLALAASSENHEVGAVVEQAGGIWYGQRERLHGLPPVLMIHGRDDRRVPFEKFALPLAELLKTRAALVETQYYAGEGHRFTQGTEEKVRDAAVAFFDRRLGR